MFTLPLNIYRLNLFIYNVVTFIVHVLQSMKQDIERSHLPLDYEVESSAHR